MGEPPPPISPPPPAKKKSQKRKEERKMINLFKFSKHVILCLTEFPLNSRAYLSFLCECKRVRNIHGNVGRNGDIKLAANCFEIQTLRVVSKEKTFYPLETFLAVFDLCHGDELRPRYIFPRDGFIKKCAFLPSVFIPQGPIY